MSSERNITFSKQSRSRTFKNIRWIPKILLASVVLFYGCTASAPEPAEESQFLLDTVVSLRLYSGNETLLSPAFEKIVQYEKQLSRHILDSPLTKLNSGQNQAILPESTAEVLNMALHYAQLTEGRFEPSIAPLVNLWDIHEAQVPSPESVVEALTVVDFRKIQFDEFSRSITLEPGMALDLGGIAKGWIADEVADFFAESGEQSILINLGGNILVRGGKPDGSSFRIGLQDPQNSRGEYLGIFALKNGSVVSSGVYERYFIKDGIRYHHILDSRTGYPIQNGLASVTIISDRSADGDALSTSLFALGLDEGLQLALDLEGIEAVFVTEENRLVMTPGAAEIFTPSQKNLEIEVRSR
ncbi:MAG: FAD:protein FMN transferase [Spirochaetales bacterium]|nr:FAD:protein FMN transferase [Spirochaetales bacterium]